MDLIDEGTLRLAKFTYTICLNNSKVTKIKIFLQIYSSFFESKLDDEIWKQIRASWNIVAVYIASKDHHEGDLFNSLPLRSITGL
jgi:hypothetical protein